MIDSSATTTYKIADFLRSPNLLQAWVLQLRRWWLPLPQESISKEKGDPGGRGCYMPRGLDMLKGHKRGYGLSSRSASHTWDVASVLAHDLQSVHADDEMLGRYLSLCGISLLVSGVRRLWNNLIDTLWTCSALLARYGIPSAQERKFDILEGGGIASLGEKNRSMELCSTAWFMESNLSLACWVAAECDVLFLWLSPQVLDGWHIVRTHYLPLSNVVFAQWHVGLLFIPGMMHVSSPCAKVWRLLPGGVIGLMSCFVLTQQ